MSTFYTIQYIVECTLAQLLCNHWILSTVYSCDTNLDTVNQGNWCLSIKLILECFGIVA